MNQEEFDEIVREFVQNKADYLYAMEKTRTAKDQRPIKPKGPIPFEQATEYPMALAEYDQKVDAAEQHQRHMGLEYERSKNKLIGAIPMANAWVTSGDYVVGKYSDAWGGWHTEVMVVLKGEELPSLNNRDYHD